MIYGSSPAAGAPESSDPSAVSAPGSIGRPSYDLTAGGWLPSAGNTLFGVINEVVPDPAYIYTSTLTTCEIALTTMATPGSILSYKASSSMGNSITVALLASESIVASWSHALTTTDDLYTHTLTAAQLSQMSTGNITVQITATS